MFARSTRIAAACLAGLFSVAALPAQTEPDFDLDIETIDGEKLTSDDLLDKVVLIDFWGTWCGPCKKAIPHLIKLHEKYSERGLVIVGLSYERGNDPLRSVRAYADKAGIPYPLAIGTAAEKNQVENFGGYPTMLFFKRGLKLDRQETGFTASKVEAMEAWILDALAEKAPTKKTIVAGPVKAVLEAGDKKLPIGDGKHAVLLVMTHPKAPADPALVARLREAAKTSKKLRVVTVTRDDIEGAEADFVVSMESLTPFRIGKAFPSFKLYDEQGIRRFRDSGIGETVNASVWKAVAPYVKAVKAVKVEKAEKAEKKQAPQPVKKAATTPVTPAKKSAAAKPARAWRRW